MTLAADTRDTVRDTAAVRGPGEITPGHAQPRLAEGQEFESP